MRTLPLRTWLILGVIVFTVVMSLAFCHAVKTARDAKAQGRVADTQASVGTASSERENDQRRAEDKGADLTQRNTDFITGADNAKDSAGEAGRRGWVAYCERERVSGRNLPEQCARL